MLHCGQFRDLIVRPTLTQLGMYSKSAEELLVGTCAHESLGGTYLAQKGNGPALGVYQVEPATFDDTWSRGVVQAGRLDLVKRICNLSSVPSPSEVVANIKLATVICRIDYWISGPKLPEPDDVMGLAQYWKQYYNSALGKGIVDDWIKHYHEFCRYNP